MAKRARTSAILIPLSVSLLACDSATGPGQQLDPADFVSGVDNAFFPLTPGTTLTYNQTTPAGFEEIVIEVTNQTRSVLGISAVVVHDRVYLDGSLIEDTWDWYAQHKNGDVWYLGEDTKEYDNGVVVSTEGSWEAGVDGAEAGIYMWADPGAHIGEEYRQEYYQDEAEDMAKVLSVTASVTVPYGSFTHCVQTADWTPLDPDVLEHKYYCAGIGSVLEIDVAGGGVRTELVTVVN